METLQQYLPLIGAIIAVLLVMWALKAFGGGMSPERLKAEIKKLDDVINNKQNSVKAKQEKCEALAQQLQAARKAYDAEVQEIEKLSRRREGHAQALASYANA
jgi:Skp family chaperone for outer membrane proteins